MNGLGLLRAPERISESLSLLCRATDAPFPPGRYGGFFRDRHVVCPQTLPLLSGLTTNHVFFLSSSAGGPFEGTTEERRRLSNQKLLGPISAAAQPALTRVSKLYPRSAARPFVRWRPDCSFGRYFRHRGRSMFGPLRLLCGANSLPRSAVSRRGLSLWHGHF